MHAQGLLLPELFSNLERTLPANSVLSLFLTSSLSPQHTHCLSTASLYLPQSFSLNVVLPLLFLFVCVSLSHTRTQSLPVVRLLSAYV